MRKCPHCPAEYTSPVNLRAHQLAKHGMPRDPNMAAALTTAELLEELERRMIDWPPVMGVVRAFVNGAVRGLLEAQYDDRVDPSVVEALNRVGVPHR
jgi:hypothetical protein